MRGSRLEDFFSRCCCSYISQMDIFVDEMPIEKRGRGYKEIDLEYIAIMWTSTLPWWSAMMALLFWVLANVQEPARDAAWHWFWERHCMPLRAWLATDGYVQRIALKFMLEDDDPPYIKGAKLGVLLAGAFVLGGALLWLTMGYIFSWVVLRMFFLCAKVVVYSKSRYYPGHEFDEIRRHAITKVPINNDSHYVEYPNALFLVKAGVGAFLYGLVLFARWVFDLLLIRSIFFIMGFGDNRISNKDILQQMPKINIKIIDETILQLIMLLAQLL